MLVLLQFCFFFLLCLFCFPGLVFCSLFCWFYGGIIQAKTKKKLESKLQILLPAKNYIFFFVVNHMFLVINVLNSLFNYLIIFF